MKDLFPSQGLGQECHSISTDQDLEKLSMVERCGTLSWNL